MTGGAATFDDRICHLGEGPLWHPTRKQLFWFDINAKQLLSQSDRGQHLWQFAEHVSAAGWVDDHHLLIASETALFQFNIETAQRHDLMPLETDNPVTRSNDGRADPWGGFWIGTMGKSAEHGAGSIYRYYQGALRKLVGDITISNAICFSPDRRFAYYADTPTRQIMRQTLDRDGWPVGRAEVFVDMTADALNPDGAVVDAQGYLWSAQWGAAQVTRYAPDGNVDQVIRLPAQQPSCPAFGGPDLTTLFVTSATQSLAQPSASDGTVQSIATACVGQLEHQVILS